MKARKQIDDMLWDKIIIILINNCGSQLGYGLLTNLRRDLKDKTRWSIGGKISYLVDPDYSGRSRLLW
jgi:hypothetical protein